MSNETQYYPGRYKAYAERINRVIDHIDDHLGDELTLEPATLPRSKADQSQEKKHFG